MRGRRDELQPLTLNPNPNPYPNPNPNPHPNTNPNPNPKQVAVTSFKEKDEIIKITCEIYCAADSQKGILIGKGGKALKAVGTKARGRMEAFFGKKVFLETRVKVSKSWRNDEAALADFGYL